MNPIEALENSQIHEVKDMKIKLLQSVIVNAHKNIADALDDHSYIKLVQLREVEEMLAEIIASWSK